MSDRYQDLPNEPSVLDNVVIKLRRVLGCDGAAILLAEGPRPSTFPCAASDGAVGPFRKGDVVPASQTPLVSGRTGWTIVDDGVGPNAALEMPWTAELRSSLWLTIASAEGVLVGVLALFHRGPNRFSGDEAPLLHIIAEQIRDILALYARLDSLTIEDEATGLGSAVYGRKRLAEEIERSARYGGCLSVVVLRLDGLEAALTQLSEQEREELLRTLGEAIASGVRATDQSAALTREAYLVIAPETDAAGALAVAARLVARIRETTDLGPGVGLHGGTATAASGQSTPDEMIVSASRAARRAATGA